MSTDSCLLSNQGIVSENIMAESDYGCPQEPAENNLSWEAAWIDIGGEG